MNAVMAVKCRNLLLFHIKGPVSHWSHETEYVLCFYFYKNKKVKKR